MNEDAIERIAKSLEEIVVHLKLMRRCLPPATSNESPYRRSLDGARPYQRRDGQPGDPAE